MAHKSTLSMSLINLKEAKSVTQSPLIACSSLALQKIRVHCYIDWWYSMEAVPTKVMPILFHPHQKQTPPPKKKQQQQKTQQTYVPINRIK